MASFSLANLLKIGVKATSLVIVGPPNFGLNIGLTYFIPNLSRSGASHRSHYGSFDFRIINWVKMRHHFGITSWVKMSHHFGITSWVNYLDTFLLLQSRLRG